MPANSVLWLGRKKKPVNVFSWNVDLKVEIQIFKYFIAMELKSISDGSGKSTLNCWKRGNSRKEIYFSEESQINSFPWFWLNGQNKILPNMTTCTRDHFQLTAPCNSLSIKYLFIGHYSGKNKLLLVRDSQFLSSPAESPGKSAFAVYLLPDISKSSPERVVTLYSLWGSRRGGIWALIPASSKAMKFLVPFLQFSTLGVGPFTMQKKGGQNLLSSTPQSYVYFINMCLKGRTEFSSALEIVSQEESQQKMVFAHSKTNQPKKTKTQKNPKQNPTNQKEKQWKREKATKIP